ncbi:hypothetical protein BM1_10429 [Bipolaris maydis]|nr:hypothetical protein BM1_10429 [Bipolaris maydis]
MAGLNRNVYADMDSGVMSIWRWEQVESPIVPWLDSVGDVVMVKTLSKEKKDCAMEAESNRQAED